MIRLIALVLLCPSLWGAFTYKRLVQINHTLVGGTDSTNFPVYFSTLNVDQLAAAGMNTSTTTAPLVTGQQISNGDYIQIDSEIMHVTAGGLTTTLTVVRAQLGTTAANHAAAATINLQYLSSSANGGYVQSASGYDIVFASDPGCASRYNYERVSWTASNGANEFYINIPTVTHSSNAQFYVCFDDATVTTDQSNRTGTWNSGFKGVWHFGTPTVLDLTDSTSNANNGTNHGGSTAIAGSWGGAVNFVAASSQYVDVGTGSSLQISPNLTLEALFFGASQTSQVQDNRDSSGNGYAMGACDGGSSNEIDFGISNSGTLNVLHATGSNGCLASTHYAAFTYDNSTILAYSQGSSAGSLSVSNGLGTSTSNFYLGRLAPTYGTGYMSNWIDEFRVSNVKRSADWITTTYNNYYNTSTFFFLGPQSLASGPVATMILD